MKRKSALKAEKGTEGETDFILKKGYPSCWIAVDGISVYIQRQDEGVSVSLYPEHQEMSDSLAEAWATFEEAKGE